MMDCSILVTFYELECWFNIGHLYSFLWANEMVMRGRFTTLTQCSTVRWVMLLATFLETTLGGPKFIHRVLSHLWIHRLKIVAVCQGTPWNCVLASERTCKERNLDCPLLVEWMVGLLEALLVLLLEVLLDC